jgi:hypothetical protein
LETPHQSSTGKGEEVCDADDSSASDWANEFQISVHLPHVETFLIWQYHYVKLTDDISRTKVEVISY